MLLVDRVGPDETWPDSVDPEMRWAVPSGLELTSDADVLLARWVDPVAGAGGGVLHLALQLGPPQPAGAQVPPWTAVRARLGMRAVATSEITAMGEWRTLPPAASPLLNLTETLTADAVQQLEDGLGAGASVVELTVEAVAHGLAGGLPVLVIVDAAAVTAHLGDGPWTVDELLAGLQSLPATGVMELHPLDGAAVPDAASIKAELAYRLATELLEPEGEADLWTPRRFRLPATLPHQAPAYDLRTFRPAAVGWSSAWSISAWAATLTPEQRAAAFPRLDGVAIFGTAPVVVVNTVPIDPAGGVRRVQVDVRATGVMGLPEQHSFVFNGGPSTARFDAVFPAWSHDPLTVSAVARAVLAPVPGAASGWSRLQSAHPVGPSGALVSVSAEDLELALCVVDVDAAAPAIAGELALTVLADQVAVAGTMVTSARRCTLAYPRAAGAVLQVSAGGRVLLERPADGGTVFVGAADLLDLEPTTVSVVLADETGRSAYAAVSLADATGQERSFGLEPGTAFDWPCRRPSRLAPLAYQWQLHWIPRRPDGSTSPLRTTPWTSADATSLTLTLPEDEVT